MQTTRAAVDERLSVIRKEARRQLERRMPVLVKSRSKEPELMAELHSIIAESCRGECFSAEEVRRYYASNAEELTRDRLAHLASCSKCLAMVAQILQFPTNFGSPPAASADRDRISCWKRKRAELLLTEPAELRLVVNGHLLATERVYQADSHFSVSIALHEALDFVEIWSGEMVRLLFLTAISEPPEGEYDQRASIDLKAGSLQLALRFQDPWPTVTVTYAARRSENVAEIPAQNRAPLANIPLQQKIRLHDPFPFGISLPTLSTAIAFVLIIALLFMQTRETTLDAAELLNRAGKWEKAVTTAQRSVLHRRFSLIRQRKGAPVQRTFVDVWRRAGLNLKLSRWTDASGRVLAEARIASSGSVHLDQGDVWQFEPSTDAFAAAAGRLEHAGVSSAADRVIIQTSFAELVLDRATNRPIGEKFSLDGTDYVFTEALTETIPLAGSPLLPAVPEARRIDKRIRSSSGSRDLKLPHFSSDEREMRVRQALHAFELATAASITTYGDVTDVRFSPTSAGQERAVRSALAKISGVKVSILSAKAAVFEAVTSNSPGSAAPASEKLAEPLAEIWLKPILGLEANVHAEEERRLQTAQHLVSLVAEWRLLAERYPEGVERHLGLDADSILRGIVGDLRTRIQQDIHDEQIAITELSRNISDGSGLSASQPPCETWQSKAVRAADLLWENEEAIEQFYAPAAPHRAIIRDTDLLLRIRGLTNAIASLLKPSCDHVAGPA